MTERKPILEHLRKTAKNAYHGLSFSPEKRGDAVISKYSSELESDLTQIPEAEKAKYIEKYTSYLSEWLHSLSRTFSTMIAGPSNFPVNKMEKLNLWADNKYIDFREWRKRALKAISRNVERNKTPEEKQNERWEKIQKNIIDHAATIILVDKGEQMFERNLFVRAISGTIKTLADEGNVELLNKSLDLVRKLNTKGPKQIITEKHAIWNLLPVAEAAQQQQVAEIQRENEEKEVNGIRIVYNYAEDRVQLFFRDKSHAEPYRQALSKNAWRWSPSNVAWQRKLTNAAKYDADNLAMLQV